MQVVFSLAFAQWLYRPIVVVVVIDGLLSKPIYHFVIDVLHTWKTVVLTPTPHSLHFQPHKGKDSSKQRPPVLGSNGSKQTTKGEGSLLDGLVLVFPSQQKQLWHASRTFRWDGFTLEA